jgi:hypothetical protein
MAGLEMEAQQHQNPVQDIYFLPPQSFLSPYNIMTLFTIPLLLSIPTLVLASDSNPLVRRGAPAEGYYNPYDTGGGLITVSSIHTI